MNKLILIVLLALPVMADAVERDANGRIVRSRAVAARFQRMHPCPSTGLRYGGCKGWVKDHKEPLACGGPDTVNNLQWQTVADGKAKDRVERKKCGQAG